MNVGLYQGVAGMVASERRIESIAHNLANLGTPAFKRSSIATQAELVNPGKKAALATVTKKRVDFAQGLLDRTENPFDLALLGDGFFAVEGPGGEMYTRNGSFRVDDKGVLQTIEGHMVAWKGARGRLDAVGQAITIDAAGNVSQGTRRAGQLMVVAFEDQTKLGLGRSGYWRASADMLPVPSRAEVHQGALERSNVNAVDELVQLVSVQRSFDSSASLMDMIDQSYRRLNQKS